MAALSLSRFWNRKDAAESVTAQSLKDRFAARTLQFLQNSNGSRTLVLGLNWRAILISGGAKTVLDRARAAGATHYCMVGVQTLAYGRVVVDKHQVIPEQVYPAALLASRLTSSEGLFALTLSPTEVWVAVVRNGRPLGFDEVLTDTTGNLPVLVRDWLVGKRDQQHRTVFTDVALNMSDLKTQPCALANLMVATVMAKDVLLVLPPSSWLARIRIPKPVMQFGFLVLVLWLGNAAWEFWTQHVKAEAERAMAAMQRASDDPMLRWRQALSGLGAGRAHPQANTLTPVRTSLGRLPARWGNWTLKGAQCLEKSIEAGQQTWHCTASYVPPDGLDVATNLQLNDLVPQGFQPKFVSMKQASLEWSVSGQVQPLNVNQLPTRQHHALDTTSLLQRYASALSTVPELKFSPIKVTPPQSSGGAPIPLPDQTNLPSEAPFTLRGPLRSIDALIQRGLPAQWRALSLTYREGAGASSSLLGSVIEAQLEGVMYAKD
jgi:hypothetical protein